MTLPAMTGLLSTTGSGKSTLFKTIIADESRDKKILVWLSEESVKQYLPKIKSSRFDYGNDNIEFFHESEISESVKRDPRILFSFFQEKAIKSEAKIIFLDNLTTSELYSDCFSFQQKSYMVDKICNFIMNYKTPVFYLAHTKSYVNDNNNRLVQGEDIFGPQKPFKRSDNFFIMQRFAIDDAFFPFIYIRKSRNVDIENR